MREFGQFVLEKVTKERPEAETLALTIHGPGYGLDEREAFFSLIGGLHQARIFHRSQLTEVQIVEKSAKRATRLRLLLEGNGGRGGSSPVITETDYLKEYGAKSETKLRLFVAMPFAPEYLDEYEIAFSEAAHRNGFLCERLDFETFVGDIFAELKKRILSSNGVIALLNDNNPNVYLEIGYAMAQSKPVILVAKKGTKIPFDVRGQRYLEYSRIGELREALASDLSKLHRNGVLNKR